MNNWLGQLAIIGATYPSKWHVLLLTDMMSFKVFVTSFLTLQRCKITVLHLLDHELHCFKLTRDYVTTLSNYKD